MQSGVKFCPQCGSPVTANQSFCAMCGTLLQATPAPPGRGVSSEETALDPRSPGGQEALPPQAVRDGKTMRQDAPVSPTPPPPQAAQPQPPPTPAPSAGPPPTFTPPPPGGPSIFQQPPGPGPGYRQPLGPPPAAAPPGVPAYAQPQKGSTGRVLAGIGCTTLIIVLVILAICGGLSYGTYLFLHNLASRAEQSTSASQITSQGESPSGTATRMPARTFPINATLIYSSITITVLDAQLASGFPDDPQASTSSALLRLQLKEANQTTDFVSYDYNQVARLILPDKSSVAPDDLQYASPPQPNSTRTNWLDFPVPATLDVSRTVLRLGASTEAQMDIPLQNNPNLTGYQPTTTRPSNAQTTYAGLKWTITSTLVSWSTSGKQAANGKRFLTLSFRIDNPSSRDVGFNVDDFMRLQIGSDRYPPTANTFTGIVKAGTTDYTGTVTFSIPAGTTSCSVILLHTDLISDSEETQIPLQLR
ncbi:zinc ribbon domain-containing protein [Thermogemmatispora sp.]|uniref:zinc ribbon domain-containing protein n=1 Tax=Thermogemmatispora sp. TaxID=1968838 RepID=UPI0035E465ED